MTHQVEAFVNTAAQWEEINGEKNYQNKNTAESSNYKIITRCKDRFWLLCTDGWSKPLSITFKTRRF